MTATVIIPFNKNKNKHGEIFIVGMSIRGNMVFIKLGHDRYSVARTQKQKLITKKKCYTVSCLF